MRSSDLRQLLRAFSLALVLTVVPALPAGAAEHQVQVNNFSFSPASLTIEVGDTVTWINVAGIHNVQADNGSFRCANGCDGEGGDGTPASNAWTVSRTFSSIADIRYFCQLHGGVGGQGMSGRVVVQQGGNDEPGTLRFSSASYAASEGGAAAVITVQRAGGDDGAVSVSYATSNGSATAGSDYTATSGTINFPDNDDDPKVFTIPITDDNAVEGSETVNLVLSNPTGGAALGNPSGATLTIADNDSGPGSPGTLSFTTGSVSVAEDGVTATLSVTRTGGDAGTVSVQYSTGDGSAEAGNDYTATSGTLSFIDGDSSLKSFAIPILDDNEVENGETLTATLSNPTGGAALGAPSAATVTIDDDDVVVPGPCIEDDFTLCLVGNRFRVQAVYRRSGGNVEQANVIPQSDTSGLLWFFSADNIEMLLKVLPACVEPFNRYWVFFSATTNVEYTVTVTDTEALRVQRYSNPLGMTALPVQDTSTFDTCP